MKLVEILARELAEWKKADQVATQDANGNIYLWTGKPKWIHRAWLETESAGACGSIFEGRDTLATDHATAIVTREMWEAERERIKRDMYSGSITAKPQWRGTEDGLPPVGVVCMLDESGPLNEFYARHAGRELKIVAHSVGREGDPIAVYECKDADGFNEYHGLVALAFRPIETGTRTPREKWIEAMCAQLKNDQLIPAHWLERCFDAGLAKLPEDGE